MNVPRFKSSHIRVRRQPDPDSLAETAHRISMSKRAGESSDGETGREDERPDEQAESTAAYKEKA